MDSAIYDGYVVPPTYDSLVARLIVHAKTREEGLMRMERALGECVIRGSRPTSPCTCASCGSLSSAQVNLTFTGWNACWPGKTNKKESRIIEKALSLALAAALLCSAATARRQRQIHL